MAEGQEERNREDLSEEPSPHRIEEFRRKGQVAQSRELSGLVALLAAGSVVYFMASGLSEDLMGLMREIFRTDALARSDLTEGTALKSWLEKALKITAGIVVPVGIAGVITGVLGSYMQIGSIFSTEPLKPDLNRINPIKGFGKYFTLKKFYDGIRIVLKFSAVAMVSYAMIKIDILQSPGTLFQEPGQLGERFGHGAKGIFYVTLGVLFVFAVFDLWLERWEYGKNIRLTKQEAKQETKEREGDPHVKARVRSIQREVARRRMMNAVKKADVVVTNPTHIAVALVYDREKMHAPKVVAKGADFVAQKIKEIAKEAGVPMVENVPLARALHKSVKIGQLVPRALYQAVAEVLAYVFRLKNKTL